MARSQAVDRELEIEGLRIHYLDWGTPGRPPLLALHGIARTAHAFDHLAPRLRDRYHVIAVDMRGHGDSAWDPQGAYMVEDYAKDVAALVGHLGLRDIVFWGNSTGGRVAQVIAGAAPELVTAVIVEDVGPERPSAVSNRRAERMGREENGWASADALLEHVKNANPRTPDAIARALVSHGSRTREDGHIVWKRDPAILKGFVPTALWDTVRRIEAPIVYILGGASTIVPPDTQMQLRAELPQVEILTMPGLGHYPSDEKPEDFLALVDGFLAAKTKQA